MLNYVPVFSISEVNKENSTDASPARYLMKIESFSSLSENGFLKYESNEFESCGYKWYYQLCISSTSIFFCIDFNLIFDSVGF